MSTLTLLLNIRSYLAICSQPQCYIQKQLTHIHNTQTISMGGFFWSVSSVCIYTLFIVQSDVIDDVMNQLREGGAYSGVGSPNLSQPPPPLPRRAPDD